MSKKHHSNPNVVYGRIPVLNVLQSNKAVRAYVQHGFMDKRVLDAIKAQKIPLAYVDADKLNQLSNRGNHQGVVLEVKPFEYSDFNSILVAACKKKNPLIRIWDEIEDPHNFGAIIRSADAFNVDGIIIKARNQVPVTPIVSKVSTGAIQFVKIAQVSNISVAMTKLKENGFWIYAADGSGKDDYQKLKYDGPVALVVGSEGRGISKLVLDNSDFVVRIPMHGHVNSLNVSVATGILLSRIKN